MLLSFVVGLLVLPKCAEVERLCGGRASALTSIKFSLLLSSLLTALLLRDLFLFVRECSPLFDFLTSLEKGPLVLHTEVDDEAFRAGDRHVVQVVDCEQGYGRRFEFDECLPARKILSALSVRLLLVAHRFDVRDELFVVVELSLVGGRERLAPLLGDDPHELFELGLEKVTARQVSDLETGFRDV